MSRYVTIEVDLEDWIVDALVEEGLFARRGNQHMQGLYLTEEGRVWLEDYCARQIQA